MISELGAARQRTKKTNKTNKKHNKSCLKWYKARRIESTDLPINFVLAPLVYGYGYGSKGCVRGCVQLLPDPG